MSANGIDKPDNQRPGAVAAMDALERAAEQTDFPSLVLHVPDSEAYSPHFRCGNCHKVLDDPGTGHTTRCPQCERHLAVPSIIGVKCIRCGHHQSIPARELATQRVCAKCGATIIVPDIELSPKHHHHHHHQNHHAVRHPRRVSKHADAAWAVLIIGLTLIIALSTLTLL